MVVGVVVVVDEGLVVVVVAVVVVVVVFGMVGTTKHEMFISIGMKR